ncbi:MAG TPA: hypothetical protein VMC86_01485 [Gemmatimonadales bacterium]|nr:hypothetical protein [Gemmatimonadales bacterium]
MRRFMAAMFCSGFFLSTPAASQSWLSLGLAATLGGGWQIEGGDIGLTQHTHFGPFRGVGETLRLGSFVDEGAIIGGARGFVGGLAFSARTGMLSLAQMGDESNASTLGVDLTLEAGGTVGSNSPFPQGSAWLGLAALPGLRFGTVDGANYVIVIGPAAFWGRGHANIHTFLGIRFETPLAKGPSRP